jgi:hypothetical protein
MTQAGAVLIYGRGGDLGDFKQFGDDLITRSLRSKYGTSIQAFRAERRDAFFDALSKAKAPISELHIFSHSFGAGLVVGYHDDGIELRRKNIRNTFRRQAIPQQVVLNTETGILFVHDLLRVPYSGLRDGLRRKFASGAFIKIWGCNSGMPNHVYSDPVERDRRQFVVEASGYTASPDYRIGAEFYWRALNGGRLPSIAQAIATYFNVPVFGATSGSHIEMNARGHWLSASRIARPIVARDDIRLHPDRGSYVEFKPSGR